MNTEAPAPATAAGAAGSSAAEPAWVSLGTPPSELQLEFTLPTGQSFRWQRIGPGEFTGVIGQRVVRLRQLEGDVEYCVLARGPLAPPSQDAQALRDYFNLGPSLTALAAGWCAADARFRHVHPHLLGARMLRQDPLECLFQFICSSNNHISRIHGMVERLCARYGTPLHLPPAPVTLSTASSSSGGNGVLGPAGAGQRGAGQAAGAGQRLAEAAAAAAAAAAATGRECAADGGCEAEGVGAGLEQPQRLFYAFPSLEQLGEATEEALREDGFGYRAKFITGSVAALLAKPGGGAVWLLGLRSVPYQQAAAELGALPGVGPKVAACVCLFSLDKHEAIPVDTHVWQLACRYYAPHLRGKSLTPRVHGEVQAAFVARFGPYAGWAHNTLFISELAAIKGRIPPAAAVAGAAASASDEEEDWGPAADTSDAPAPTGKKRRKKAGGKAAAAAAALAAEEAEAAHAAQDAGAAPRKNAAAGKRNKGPELPGVGAAASAEAREAGSLGGWRQRKARP